MAMTSIHQTFYHLSASLKPLFYFAYLAAKDKGIIDSFTLIFLLSLLLVF
jgi:hypothetical protein